MLLAAGWTWPAVVVFVAVLAFVALFGITAMARNFVTQPTAAGAGMPRLKRIEEELVAVREDLAEIKESLAELDRLFKSVG